MLSVLLLVKGQSIETNSMSDSLSVSKVSIPCVEYFGLLDTINEEKQDSIISLYKISTINIQIDSILSSIIRGLNMESKMFFYITMMKQDNDIYIEITGVLNNYGLFEFDLHERSNDNYLREGTKVYGCLRKHNKDFYVLSYPPPYDISIKDFKQLFKIDEEKIDLKRTGFSEVVIFENPMWLYLYSRDNISLLKSINDKNFFVPMDILN